MRASIYNAMPIEGVEALVAFMKKFEEENAVIGYKYYCLNPISQMGLDQFTDRILQQTEEVKEADAILVRSAVMHEMEFDTKSESSGKSRGRRQ